jgi:hypothetical protein
MIIWILTVYAVDLPQNRGQAQAASRSREVGSRSEGRGRQDVMLRACDVNNIYSSILLCYHVLCCLFICKPTYLYVTYIKYTYILYIILLL